METWRTGWEEVVVMEAEERGDLAGRGGVESSEKEGGGWGQNNEYNIYASFMTHILHLSSTVLETTPQIVLYHLHIMLLEQLFALHVDRLLHKSGMAGVFKYGVCVKVHKSSSMYSAFRFVRDAYGRAWGHTCTQRHGR